MGELETELRAAGTDAAVLAARLRESERAVAEARAEAAASVAASAGWERLANERGGAVEQLQQARGPFLCITRPEWYATGKQLCFISSTSCSVWCCLVDRSAGWEHLAAKCGIASCSCSGHSEVTANIQRNSDHTHLCHIWYDHAAAASSLNMEVMCHQLVGERMCTPPSHYIQTRVFPPDCAPCRTWMPT